MEPSLSLTAYEIFAFRYIWITTFTWRHQAHVTIWYPRCHFQQVFHCNWVCISCISFEIMGPKRIGSQPWRLTVTFHGHVTSSFTWPFDSAWCQCHFLLVVDWNRSSISNCFRDLRFGLKHSHAELSLRLRDITCDVPSVQNLSIHYFTFPPLLTRYGTVIELRLKNKGFIIETSNVKVEIERKFYKSKNCQILAFYTGTGVRGTLREFMSFKPFLCEDRLGVWSLGVFLEKSESHRTSHRNEVSTLTWLELPVEPVII